MNDITPRPRPANANALTTVCLTTFFSPRIPTRLPDARGTSCSDTTPAQRSPPDYGFRRTSLPYLTCLVGTGHVLQRQTTALAVCRTPLPGTTTFITLATTPERTPPLVGPDALPRCRGLAVWTGHPTTPCTTPPSHTANTRFTPLLPLHTISSMIHCYTHTCPTLFYTYTRGLTTTLPPPCSPHLCLYPAQTCHTHLTPHTPPTPGYPLPRPPPPPPQFQPLGVVEQHFTLHPGNPFALFAPHTLPWDRMV